MEENKIQKNNIEIEDEETMARKYYRTYREAMNHTRAGDVIQFDPFANRFYIIHPNVRIGDFF